MNKKIESAIEFSRLHYRKRWAVMVMWLKTDSWPKHYACSTCARNYAQDCYYQAKARKVSSKQSEWLIFDPGGWTSRLAPKTLQDLDLNSFNRNKCSKYKPDIEALKERFGDGE